METFPVILKNQTTTTQQVVLPSFSKGGRNLKKGPSEIVAFSRIAAMGLSEIHADACVLINGHRYEPDFVYVDPKNNIYVDIEVDEPYSAGGKPTHYMNNDGTNSDTVRNQRFVNAGWHVCRFSEEQIFCHTKECMKAVYSMLLETRAISELPKSLHNVPDLQPQDRWTFNDSQELKRQRYRNTYWVYNEIKETGYKMYL